MSNSLQRFGDLLAYPLRSGVTVNSADRGFGIKMINMGELFRFRRLGDVEMSRVNINYSDSERFLVSAGDLLFARRSLTPEGAGKCSIVLDAPEATTWESSIIRARINPTKADPRYYYYLLRSAFGRTLIATIVEQVAVAGIRSSDLANLQVPCPPLSAQRRVSDVLSALDDKIAVNDRIASTALALADSHVGMLTADESNAPMTVFADVANVYGGGTPSTKELAFWDGGSICWATPSDITKLTAPYLFDTEKKITHAGLTNCASQLHPPGSIFMTSRATIGRFAINEVPAATNQGFIVVRPFVPEQKWWLFHEMRRRVDEMISISNGSTFLELSRTNFKAMTVTRPSDEALAGFNELVEPLHRRASAGLIESATLAELRDTLLLKLISGELRIKDAERVVSDAV